MPAEGRALTCTCGSSDLVLTEVLREVATYDEGLFLDGEGKIRAHGDGIVSHDGPEEGSVRIECKGCGRYWRPRRRFAGAAT